jgi:hypothetical protein
MSPSLNKLKIRALKLTGLIASGCIGFKWHGKELKSSK